LMSINRTQDGVLGVVTNSRLFGKVLKNLKKLVVTNATGADTHQ
jgi:hypothetical protein